MSFAYLEHLSDACLVSNLQGEIIFWNNALIILSDYKDREVKKIRLLKEFITFEDEISELSVECSFHFSNKKTGFGLVRKVLIDDSVLIIIKDLSVERSLHQKYHNQLQELKTINQNLEQTVADRTEELRRSNKYLFDLIESFRQAIFTVSERGEIDIKQGLNLSVVMKEFPYQLSDLFSTAMTREQTEQWLKLLFTNALPFEEMIPLAPQELEISGEIFKLNYYPYFSGKDQLDSIIVAMTNISEEVKIRQDLDAKTKFAASLLKASLAQDRYQVAMGEVRDLFEKLLSTDIGIQSFKANLHALKGLFSYYGPMGFDEFIHQIEISSEALKEKQIKLKSLKNPFENIFHEIQFLLPMTSSEKKILPQEVVLKIFEADRIELVKDLLVPFIYIDLEAMIISMNDYVQELSNSTGKFIKNFKTNCSGIYLESSLNKLLNQFFIQGLRNAFAHGFSSGEFENEIEICASELNQSCLIQVKTNGMINNKAKEICVLNGMKQGLSLTDEIALTFGASLQLIVIEEEGTSCLELMLPARYLKRKEHV